MSGLARWSRTHPLQRNLLGVGIVLVVLIGALSLVSGVSRPAPSSPGPVAGRGAQAPAEEPVATAPVDQLTQAFSEAQPTTTAFLEAYSSYRWDDGLQSLQERLRPYVTPALLASLGEASGGGAAQAEQVLHHQTTVGHVTQLTPLGLSSDGRLSLAGSVSQEIGSDAGKRQQEMSVALILVHQEAGWRVDKVSL